MTVSATPSPRLPAALRLLDLPMRWIEGDDGGRTAGRGWFAWRDGAVSGSCSPDRRQYCFRLDRGSGYDAVAIIVRREFGAQAFGLVFGAAHAASSWPRRWGRVFYGVMHDAFGSYDPALIGARAWMSPPPASPSQAAATIPATCSDIGEKNDRGTEREIQKVCSRHPSQRTMALRQ